MVLTTWQSFLLLYPSPEVGVPGEDFAPVIVQVGKASLDIEGTVNP